MQQRIGTSVHSALHRAGIFAATAALVLGGSLPAGPVAAAQGPGQGIAAATFAGSGLGGRNPANVDELFNEYVSSVEPGTLGKLQAIMQTADGFIIQTGGGAGSGPARPAALSLEPGRKQTPEQFVARYPKVALRQALGPAETIAATDVLGGMGYGTETRPGIFALCSLGFSAFNPAGAPAAISAGHCTQDGRIRTVSVEKPSTTDGFGGLGPMLGQFGFSQFGGPRNAPTKALGNLLVGNIGTDVSVIDRLNPALRPLPAVTGWKGGNPHSGEVKVTGISRATLGTKVCKSGRTTGFTCGIVDEVGIFVVGGFKNTAADIRAVRGFGMANPGFSKAYEGDSGGAVMAGTKAVGITSAISNDDRGRAYFADIGPALKVTGGYSLRLFLPAPKLKLAPGTAAVPAGSRIHGTVAGAPAGTNVQVLAAGKKIATATVTHGAFSFRAPAVAGAFKFSLQAVNGYSKSSLAPGNYTLVLPPPKVTAPAKGSASTRAPGRITGTGVPGATVSLTGAVTGKGTVTAKGTWSIKAAGSWKYGKNSFTAMQKQGKHASAGTKSTFTLVPAAPSISSPVSGRKYPYAKAPRTVSGRGISGATLKVTVGKATRSTTVVKGRWSVKIPAPLKPGSHVVTAIQIAGNTASSPAKSTFGVAKEPKR